MVIVEKKGEKKEKEGLWDDVQKGDSAMDFSDFSRDLKADMAKSGEMNMLGGVLPPPPSKEPRDLSALEERNSPQKGMGKNMGIDSAGGKASKGDKNNSNFERNNVEKGFEPPERKEVHREEPSKPNYPISVDSRPQHTVVSDIKKLPDEGSGKYCEVKKHSTMGCAVVTLTLNDIPNRSTVVQEIKTKILGDVKVVLSGVTAQLKAHKNKDTNEEVLSDIFVAWGRQTEKSTPISISDIVNYFDDKVKRLLPKLIMPKSSPPPGPEMKKVSDNPPPSNMGFQIPNTNMGNAQGYGSHPQQPQTQQNEFHNMSQTSQQYQAYQQLALRQQQLLQAQGQTQGSMYGYGQFQNNQSSNPQKTPEPTMAQRNSGSIPAGTGGWNAASVQQQQYMQGWSSMSNVQQWVSGGQHPPHGTGYDRLNGQNPGGRGGVHSMGGSGFHGNNPTNGNNFNNAYNYYQQAQQHLQQQQAAAQQYYNRQDRI